MSKLTVTEADRLIGKRIQQRRKEKKLTAASLSEEIGVSQQQLSRYERGTNKINVTHLIDIASHLDTPISWFFIGHDEDKKQAPEQVYQSVKAEELRNQLDLLWTKLSTEQQRAFITLLDTLTN
ncbi:helix-turn-helix domain-containing protein [Yersinia pseudotuberculosis]|uniref:helix-turn-helix domain-containing protein n=1 Tax=Yersinia pseudotuberculosis TaxID=633 RepID=UPI00061BDD6F|nr:helix-turn-helix domain-containing protein [Yersinia pseudotuberculosis]EKI5684841.1 helix-turn-helix domain-containing protein [Salmonella enterica]AXY35078.1 helix-turn-helix domain-containing protein [Yersinia pseudotuberculosis]AYX10740.1 helix-turn-helix domain-containing protein [Yersinia pseudotuberculosis]MBO1566336.1 helix-turn-helix domain-containing protein [Yersinia pseudotuberculosis]MBO1589534.1 helix-turn-helix domain-containing protein [Yersinia pseudotuberculosis]